MFNLILPAYFTALPQALLEPSGALGLQPCLEEVKVPVPATSSLPLVAIEPLRATSVGRCTVRGCVFPAAAVGIGECHYHTLLRSEAVLFQSHQPSHLLLLHAPLGIPEEPVDDSRQQDRKRLAAEREEFVMEEPV